MLLNTAYGQHDVDVWLATHPTTMGVDPESVDAVLAGLGEPCWRLAIARRWPAHRSCVCTSATKD
jgi:hypothetical protein